MHQHSPRRRRTVLVAPGSDERKARKALASAADEVILDLEDAVTPADKKPARDLVRRLLRETPRANGLVSVRVNGLTTPWARDDLAACAGLPALASIVLPKTESAQDLIRVDRALAGTGIGVQALVETPLGIQNLDEIATASRLEAVIIGYADLGAALGRSRSARPEHWLAIQDRVLIAARAAGIAAIDGPHLGIAADEQFRQACEWTATLGFDGKWVIHPGQVEMTMQAFTPTESAVQEARRVLDALAEAHAHGTGAVQLDGQMLDEAVAVAARRVLAQVGEQ
ncbi:CoA ester lyase [Nocardia sp. NPDC019395]|uniref:HpcH/HpaI aldolase/citrate lyase family protein n=1 Tax=Nocardia sp. NPDC019395 TaxID=3154686 RepID=UPI00340F3627